MKITSMRELRSGISGYSKEGERVLIMNHGRMVGCFLPLQKSKGVPIELKKELVVHLGEQISHALTLWKISEEDILNDFRQYKKSPPIKMRIRK